MARSRNIKPAFFKNEDLADTEHGCRLFFIGLWTLADKNGLVEYRPRRIHAELFPYEHDIDLNGYITVLTRLGHLRLLKGQNRTYLLVENFNKHQHPHHTEKTDLPEPKSLESIGIDDLTVKTPLSNGYNPSDSLIPHTDSLTSVEQDAPAPTSPPVIDLPLNDNSEFPIMQPHIDEWVELYPAVDVMQELRNMKGWLNANKRKRKTKAGILKFINNWLSRTQNNGGTRGFSGTQQPQFTEAELKAMT